METFLITGHWWGKGESIYIAARTGKGLFEIRDVHFTNITADAQSGMMIYGAPDSIVRDIYLDQLRLHIRAPLTRIAHLSEATSTFAGPPLVWQKPSSTTTFQLSMRAMSMDCAFAISIFPGAITCPLTFQMRSKTEDSKNIDYRAFKPFSAPGSTAKPIWIH